MKTASISSHSVRTGAIPKAAGPRLVDLDACIAHLDKTGNLVRVKSEVDPVHELAGVAKRLEGGKCVFFERVKGSQCPVLIGLLWNRRIVGSLFETDEEEVPFLIAKAIGEWKEKKHAFPSAVLERGPANEVVEEKVDLYRLPVPVHALEDGGRYLDASVVVVRNPQTGLVNTSVHRMMVTKKDRLTFLIDPERHLGAYLEAKERENAPLEVTINNGVGLAPWLASIIPQQGDEKNRIAHHLIGAPISLLKAQTVDVPAYADAQFVIEAEILPRVREAEGPFAEVTGYYAAREKRWVMRVKAITHRKNPVFHTLLSGQEVWNAVGLTAEAKIFAQVKARVPQLRAVYLPPGGCGFYGAVVQVEKDGTGTGRAAIREAFRAFAPLQRVVAVDTDVDLRDAVDVDWAITTRFDANKDLIVLRNQAGHILNPMVRLNRSGTGGTVTKVGMDATAPYPRSARFERVKFKQVQMEGYLIGEKRDRPSGPARARTHRSA